MKQQANKIWNSFFDYFGGDRREVAWTVLGIVAALMLIADPMVNPEVYAHSKVALLTVLGIANALLITSILLLTMMARKAKAKRLSAKTRATMRQAESAAAEQKRDQAVKYAQAVFVDNEM